MSHSANCGKNHAISLEGEEERLVELQSRIDDLLAGTPDVEATATSENARMFSVFSSRDARRAGVLAALCSKIVDEVGGVQGLEQAVDKLYSKLENSPLGMVQYATKLFLTHSKPARNTFEMRSLEERQPGVVQPSQSASQPA